MLLRDTRAVEDKLKERINASWYTENEKTIMRSALADIISAPFVEHDETKHKGWQTGEPETGETYIIAWVYNHQHCVHEHYCAISTYYEDIGWDFQPYEELTYDVLAWMELPDHFKR